MLLARLLVLPTLAVLPASIAWFSYTMQPVIIGWSLLCVARTLHSISHGSAAGWHQHAFHAALVISLVPGQQALQSSWMSATLQSSRVLSHTLATAEVRGFNTPLWQATT